MLDPGKRRRRLVLDSAKREWIVLDSAKRERIMLDAGQDRNVNGSCWDAQIVIVSLPAFLLRRGAQVAKFSPSCLLRMGRMCLFLMEGICHCLGGSQRREEQAM
jgi:hypothetical protein